MDEFASDTSDRAELEREFNMLPRKTSYRKADVSVMDALPLDKGIKERIEMLRQKDEEFCNQLQDKSFHDIFWRIYYSGPKGFSPKSVEEELVRSAVYDAIASRVQLVSLMKLQMIDNYHQIDEEERETLCRHVSTEFGFMLQWLWKDMPRYLETRRDYLDLLFRSYDGDSDEGAENVL